MRVKLDDDAETEAALEAALAEIGAVVELVDWSVTGAISTSTYRVELLGARSEAAGPEVRAGTCKLVTRSFEGTLIEGDRGVVELLRSVIIRLRQPR